MRGANTERLWITDPRRRTALAEVIDVRGDRFRLDRSLFKPTTRAYRHPQRPDKGWIWVQGGNKHRLRSAFLDPHGVLWHRVEGERPAVGDRLQCHLDQRLREQDSRAHTAMHLLLAALHQAGGPPLTSDPEVRGGGHFRLELARFVAPHDLKAWLDRVDQFIAQDRKVERVYATREEAHHHFDEQAFTEPDPYPGPETSLEGVAIEGISAYPCDGTHVERTSEVGRLVIVEAHPGSGGFVVVGRAVDA